MSFSTRANPRIGQSNAALTSLGAVGGPRGTAAGALRVFVEFLTTYDRKALGTLEDDLRQIDHASNNSAVAEEKRQRRLTQVKNSLAEAERVVRGKLNTELRADLKRIEELESSRSKTNRQAAAQERTAFNQVAKSLGLTKSELELLGNRAKLKKEEAVLTERQAAAEQGQLARTRQRAQLEGQIGKLQAGRASLLPKLGGLAIGAVGGILGGAVLGVGFQLADTAIQKFGDSLQDLVDPARHARDAISDLGDEVLKLAEQGDLTLFEAATKKAEELGVGVDNATVSLLAEFAAQKKAADAAKEYGDFVVAAAHGESLRDESIKKLTESLITQAKAENDRLIAARKAANLPVDPAFLLTLPYQAARKGQKDLIDGENALTAATNLYDQIVRENTQNIDENARARQNLANATAFAKLQQDALTNALQAAADAQTGKIDQRIDALSNAGPSARTNAIQAALDRAQGGGGSSNAGQLRNLADERAIILLRQRLRLLGTNINLERYSGKFLLEAINAKIAALQKEGDQQARLNRLLDLQYRQSQLIKRTAGESIQDFIERRAQEQRAQLQEGQDIQRDNEIAKLEAFKERVADEVALAENAQQKQDALRQQGTSNHIKNLQKQLEASQKADKKALEAKKKALEAEKAAIVKKTAEAIELAGDQATGETLAAISGAKSLSDLAILQGRIEGLQRAKGTIEGLVEAFGIPSFIAAPFLANIQKGLNAYTGKVAKLTSIAQAFGRERGGHQAGFASGGVIELSNSRSPFGSNARFGEQGTELGVILSNRVTQALRNQGGGPQQVGPFNLYGSIDPLRDRYMIKRTVEEALSEALG